jgi:hypothetical protein
MTEPGVVWRKVKRVERAAEPNNEIVNAGLGKAVLLRPPPCRASRSQS